MTTVRLLLMLDVLVLGYALFAAARFQWRRSVSTLGVFLLLLVALLLVQRLGLPAGAP